LLFGDKLDFRVKEHGIWYAIDLTMNRDASFYLDTRNLRKWLIEKMKGKSVLNTFAYTGSLGVAAMAGGASRVVQTDRNRQFLNLAKDSHSLNGFPIHKTDFIAQDFFPTVAKLKSTKQLFDCVIIDPPFFSTTPKGKVDLENGSTRLINKVRPLINDGGTLITINNALYVSGKEYMQTLESLCKDGYLSIRELIPVPADFIGDTTTDPITDPTPFNHSTKIAVLDVKRK
jgi:23S rRNA (cytosine1962-C5)-methyltransferase